MEWIQIVYLLEMIIIALVFFMAKEVIMERIYGVRFKRWIEIDTGRYGYVILDKALDSCKILGQIKTVNRANINRGWLYFVNDNCENLKVEDAKDKYQFYCNSEEFDTVYKNKLLQNLMMSLQTNWLMIIVVLVVISLAIGGYSLYNDSHNTQAKLDYLIAQIPIAPTGDFK